VPVKIFKNKDFSMMLKIKLCLTSELGIMLKTNNAELFFLAFYY
jgi:hypothetical protein